MDPAQAAPVPVFALDHVGVVRDGHRVLADVSLDLPAVGVTALVGPSGCGKSTLLRLLNRLIAPTHGLVRLRGEDLAAIGTLEVRRRVGLVLQRPLPFPGSVADNLRAGRPGLTEPAMRRLLERCALAPDLLDRRADTLSGGEAQRMCLARALAVGPEVLVADEPTSALDPDAAAIVEGLLRGLAADGVPVVVACHDPGQVARLADTVVRMDAGRVVGVEG